MEKARLAVIGGTGVYKMEEITIVKAVKIQTPFGDPSDRIMVGKFGDGENIAFLPRHGRGHRLLPTEVPSKANIWALKSLGVEHIIGISAVGSLKEEIHPGDIVIPDQVIDRTKSRPNSYFGNGIVGHVAFAEPFCPDLRKILIDNIRSMDYKFHDKATYVCMEGPLFSTKAESHLHRSWGASLIGMTLLPEAKMAREAEICYATIALPTDYDCWLETEEAVSVDMVLETSKKNIAKVKNIIKQVIYKIPVERKCICPNAAQHAIMTDPAVIPKKEFKKLELFYGKYVKV
ncbi:MAG: S-methyl-5'-thioadenosine phosphorylase [Spirochaetes bacterium]|nr:S-methyl-5'-thioadenosine phosphorylase [Spirochaetota bacterium]